MNIAPVLNIEREKMGTLGILLKIDDGVYVYIYTIYTAMFKNSSHHTHLSMSVIFQQKIRVNDVVQ